MLRQVCAQVTRKSVTSSYFASSWVPLSIQSRWKATNASTDSVPSRNNTQGQRGHFQNVLPPAFDIVHWNDADMAKGHLLRFLHRDSYVVLDYYTQAKAVSPVEGETASRAGRAQRAVSVALPPVYVARLLAVLEGKSVKADIHLRLTSAVFEVAEGSGPHHFTLRCSSSTPGSESAPLEWCVSFDPAESLLLHRFLSQCLQYNTGFCRPVLSSS